MRVELRPSARRGLVWRVWHEGRHVAQGLAEGEQEARSAAEQAFSCWERRHFPWRYEAPRYLPEQPPLPAWLLPVKHDEEGTDDAPEL